ncbi:cytochrome P450 [Acidocella sp.]|uniref:cytochrome P450 n=1 Tax=Acidocella sp. TaxID=50710 RepID=UPI0026198054|nr:cytochrome P450 [Acidocella sp.]
MAAGCPHDIAGMTLQGNETRLDPLIRNNPFAFYEAMRAQRPVYYDPGLDVYLVSRYDDASTVLRDAVTYSLEHGYQDRYANGHVEEFAAIMAREGGGFIRDLAIDPPGHTRLRKLTEQAFTAHRVRELEPRIAQIAAALIEPLAERGHADGMKNIAAPLTARIICEQMGFDFDKLGAEKIALWTTAVLAQIGRMQTRDEMLANATVMCELQHYVMARIREREAVPREDLVSDLIHARIAGDTSPALSFEEQVSTVRGFLIAGNDTTAAAIANLFLVLATQEGLADWLYARIDDDRIMARFVEEVLRLRPPVHGLFRTAMRDVELGGTFIPAGAQLCIMFASANYDTAKFACPERLDLERANVGSNLTFGAGIHRCVGAALARMEIRVAAREIIRRLDDIRLAVPVEQLSYLPTLATHTLERLPLLFRRRKAA